MRLRWRSSSDREPQQQWRCRRDRDPSCHRHPAPRLPRPHGDPPRRGLVQASQVGRKDPVSADPRLPRITSPSRWIMERTSGRASSMETRSTWRPATPAARAMARKVCAGARPSTARSMSEPGRASPRTSEPKRITVRTPNSRARTSATEGTVALISRAHLSSSAAFSANRWLRMATASCGLMTRTCYHGRCVGRRRLFTTEGAEATENAEKTGISGYGSKPSRSLRPQFSLCPLW